MFFGRSGYQLPQNIRVAEWSQPVKVVAPSVFSTQEVEIRSMAGSPLKQPENVFEPISSPQGSKSPSHNYRPLLMEIPNSFVRHTVVPAQKVELVPGVTSQLAGLQSRSMSVGTLTSCHMVHSRPSITHTYLPASVPQRPTGTQPPPATFTPLTIFGRKGSVPVNHQQEHPEKRAHVVGEETRVTFVQADTMPTRMPSDNGTANSEKQSNSEIIEALGLIRQLMEQNKQLIEDGAKYREELAIRDADYEELWQEIGQIKQELDTVKSSALNQQMVNPKASATGEPKSAGSVLEGKPQTNNKPTPATSQSTLKALVARFRGVLARHQPAPPETPQREQECLAVSEQLEVPVANRQSECPALDLRQQSPLAQSEMWMDPRDLVSSRECTKDDEMAHYRQNSSWTEARKSMQIALMDSKMDGQPQHEVLSVEPLPQAWTEYYQTHNPSPQSQSPASLFQLSIPFDSQPAKPKLRIKPGKSTLLKIAADSSLVGSGEQPEHPKPTELLTKPKDEMARSSVKFLKKLSSRESVTSKPGKNLAETSTAPGNSESPVSKGTRLFNPRDLTYPQASSVPELVFKYKTHGTSAMTKQDPLTVVRQPSSGTTGSPSSIGRGLVRSGSNKLYK